ncbi:MAG: hypothetical protein ACLGI9_22585 [Thermoanaerobaculia bacterium]
MKKNEKEKIIKLEVSHPLRRHALAAVKGGTGAAQEGIAQEGIAQEGIAQEGVT